MKAGVLIICVLVTLAGTAGFVTASVSSRHFVITKIDKEPVIDGVDTDPAWVKAKDFVTHDNVADIDLTLKAVYSDKNIFFMVRFPDPDKSDTHKSWIWDMRKKLYRTGPDREDCFVGC